MKKNNSLSIYNTGVTVFCFFFCLSFINMLCGFIRYDYWEIGCGAFFMLLSFIILVWFDVYALHHKLQIWKVDKEVEHDNEKNN